MTLFEIQITKLNGYEKIIDMLHNSFLAKKDQLK